MSIAKRMMNILEGTTNESDPSLKPPKRWFNKMHKRIMKSNPDYSSEQTDATIGKIWYGLPKQKRVEIRGREGKKYGPAEGVDKLDDLQAKVTDANARLKDILAQLKVAGIEVDSFEDGDLDIDATIVLKDGRDIQVGADGVLSLNKTEESPEFSITHIGSVEDIKDLISLIKKEEKVEGLALAPKMLSILSEADDTESDEESEEPDVDPEQLKMGLEVETEHTDTLTQIIKYLKPDISDEDLEELLEIGVEAIALDHLSELDDYYTRLAEMEGK